MASCELRVIFSYELLGNPITLGEVVVIASHSNVRKGEISVESYGVKDHRKIPGESLCLQDEVWLLTTNITGPPVGGPVGLNIILRI